MPIISSPISSVSTSSAGGVDIFRDTAVAMPSIRISEEEEKQSVANRKIYGGKGDKKHLGGFTALDLDGVSPSVWRHMIEYFGVKSLVDVGCGKGVSTSFFATHGVDVTCVEGSHDAVSQTLLPDPENQVVEHDFSRGPWWPSHTVDAVWSVEFTEHVGRNFQQNYLPIFHKAAFIFVTHSTWGGWHHVEVHEDPWWRARFESQGFVYSDDLTQMVRTLAREESSKHIPAFQNKNYAASHVGRTMQVFINPAVARLPAHAHLLAEGGCFVNYVKPTRHCEDTPGESKIPMEYRPLTITNDMELEWKKIVTKSLEEGPNV
eukprot:CAMPEP_0198292914 /NCGR_PEP_ID=MMETSP1449-20131203/14726_1 /TAXON_ID=420275 /ORGANISM="Attheya septentrionalis, Strain CCMP2084" /LENGTH=318 /DNA_ID=CAMNT_0043992273 /DNA_START=183 /DNA_END=1139 /DNA_ORIENTATION=-